eukprot:GDKJ01027981.1.p1 GENE.GDKJ01027981.1~~GDKJ01027981.1.p1  ORF type:complete len:895 (+),score=185.88 GDKJ01027981.1:35-2719(+)
MTMVIESEDFSSTSIYCCHHCHETFASEELFAEHITPTNIIGFNRAKSLDVGRYEMLFQRGQPSTILYSNRDTFHKIDKSEVFPLLHQPLCKALGSLRRFGLYFSKDLCVNRIDKELQQYVKRHKKLADESSIYMSDFFVDGNLRPRDDALAEIDDGNRKISSRKKLDNLILRENAKGFIKTIRLHMQEILEKIFPDHVVTYQEKFDRLRALKGDYDTALHEDHTLQHRTTHYDPNQGSLLTTWIALTDANCPEGLSFFFPSQIKGVAGGSGVWGGMDGVKAGAVAMFMENKPHGCFRTIFTKSQTESEGPLTLEQSLMKKFRASLEMRWSLRDKRLPPVHFDLGEEKDSWLPVSDPRVQNCPLCVVRRIRTEADSPPRFNFRLDPNDEEEENLRTELEQLSADLINAPARVHDEDEDEMIIACRGSETSALVSRRDLVLRTLKYGSDRWASVEDLACFRQLQNLAQNPLVSAFDPLHLQVIRRLVYRPRAFSEISEQQTEEPSSPSVISDDDDLGNELLTSEEKRSLLICHSGSFKPTAKAKTPSGACSNTTHNSKGQCLGYTSRAMASELKGIIDDGVTHLPSTAVSEIGSLSKKMKEIEILYLTQGGSFDARTLLMAKLVSENKNLFTEKEAGQIHDFLLDTIHYRNVETLPLFTANQYDDLASKLSSTSSKSKSKVVRKSLRDAEKEKALDNDSLEVEHQKPQPLYPLLPPPIALKLLKLTKGGMLPTPYCPVPSADLADLRLRDVVNEDKKKQLINYNDRLFSRRLAHFAYSGILPDTMRFQELAGVPNVTQWKKMAKAKTEKDFHRTFEDYVRENEVQLREARMKTEETVKKSSTTEMKKSQTKKNQHLFSISAPAPIFAEEETDVNLKDEFFPPPKRARETAAPSNV